MFILTKARTKIMNLSFRLWDKKTNTAVTQAEAIVTGDNRVGMLNEQGVAWLSPDRFQLEVAVPQTTNPRLSVHVNDVVSFYRHDNPKAILSGVVGQYGRRFMLAVDDPKVIGTIAIDDEIVFVKVIGHADL